MSTTKSPNTTDSPPPQPASIYDTTPLQAADMLKHLRNHLASFSLANGPKIHKRLMDAITLIEMAPTPENRLH